MTAEGRGRTGCGCPYDEHDPWCPTLNQPPTERDGLRVGDRVLLVPMNHLGPWPARIVGFQATSECCMVVEWTGVSPSLAERNTVCRKHLAEVRPLTDHASGRTARSGDSGVAS